MADAWCAAFMQPKTTRTPLAIVVTTRVLRRIADADPEGIWPRSRRSCSPSANPGGPVVLTRNARHHRRTGQPVPLLPLAPRVPAHLPRPRGLRRRAGPQGWEGGFTCIVGNPPWETVQMTGEGVLRRVRTRDRRGSQRSRAQGADRRAAGVTAPGSSSLTIRAAARRGREPLLPRTQGAFRSPRAERSTRTRCSPRPSATLSPPEGRSGVITPTGLGDGCHDRRLLLGHLGKRIAWQPSSTSRTRPKIFPGVGTIAFDLPLRTFAGRGLECEASVLDSSWSDTTPMYPARSFSMSPGEVLQLNPNTGTLPMFRSSSRRGPHARDLPSPPRAHPRRRSRRQPLGPVVPAGVVQHGQRLPPVPDGRRPRGARRDDSKDGLGPQRNPDGSTKQWLPLYEAKMLSHWDHRFSTYRGRLRAQLNVGSLPRLTTVQHDDPSFEPLARYWVDDVGVKAGSRDRSDRAWLLGWRDITNAGNERTMVPVGSSL